jgi:thiamine pyrophosphate-dependent acetolactate synthase large subunit-like protein
MIGAAGNRPRLVEALSDFVRRVRIPFFNTQMGKGAVTGGSNLYMGTAALSERDYVHQAIDRADLIISIGHDTVEKPPFIMGKNGPTVIHIGFTSANVEQVFFPHAEVIGDIGSSLPLLAERLDGKLEPDGSFLDLRQKILNHINEPTSRVPGVRVPSLVRRHRSRGKPLLSGSTVATSGTGTTSGKSSRSSSASRWPRIATTVTSASSAARMPCPSAGSVRCWSARDCQRISRLRC